MPCSSAQREVRLPGKTGVGTAACWQGVKRAGVHCRGPWPSSQSKTRNQQAQRPATSNQQKSRDRNTLLPEFSPPQAKAPCSWHTPWALRLSRELKSLPRGAGDPMVWGGVPELPIQEACSIVLLSTTEFWGPAGVSASPVPGDLSDHPSGSLQSTRATNRLRQPLFVQGLGFPVRLFHLDLLLQVFSPSHEILNLSVKQLPPPAWGLRCQQQ